MVQIQHFSGTLVYIIWSNNKLFWFETMHLLISLKTWKYYHPNAQTSFTEIST